MRTLWLGILLAGVALARPNASPLWEDLNDQRNDATPRHLTPAEMRDATELFGELVRTAPGGVLPQGFETRADAMGFSVRVDEENGWVVMEPATEAADGLYVVRMTESSPVIVQAPHAWYDLKTGRLASLLFEEGTGQLLMLNSGQRYAFERADLAHADDTYYQAFTIAAAQSLDQPLVVQLHGFADENSRASTVLSPGSALADPADLADSRWDLTGLLPGRSKSGDSVPKLAGRTNSQGIALSSHARFLHLELSKKARSELVQEPEVRAELAEMLEDWTR
ncbi:MAG: hypothetical protein GY884_15815 [Proteobacteria bacterium]|nr:hypothetical protein [Pseudomonadota bacterium]